MKGIIIAIVVIGAAVLGYLYWQTLQVAPTVNTSMPPQEQPK